jgi:hypothetical protein
VAIIRGIHLNLEPELVLRREGIRNNSQVKPEIITLIDELLVNIEDEHILEPAVIYEIHPINKINKKQLSLGQITLNGSIFSSALPNATELAVILCTIGPQLENKVTEYLSRGEPLRGMLLDGIGSAAVDSLSQEACKLITGIASSQGHQASSPFSPGMSGFPITEQRQLFNLISPERIGVSLSISGVMVPLKSVSMVVGIGQGMIVRKQGEVCARCNLSKTCHYRVGK